ncbi:hypothetical protein [Enemella sp. A6]|uniref:hypothetical protein n=1 Tax=Enemella sp. A6 TaxID=3440152 RepID=UPI003EBD4DC1
MTSAHDNSGAPRRLEKTWHDTLRRTAALAGATVTAILVVMFLLEAFGVWRPLGQSLFWAALFLPAVIWTIWFGTTVTYRVVLDEHGITRTRGKHELHLPWDEVTDVVKLPTRQRHLAVLSAQAEMTREPGEMGLIRAYRLPRFGVVVQADDELREALLVHSGQRLRTVEEIVT